MTTNIPGPDVDIRQCADHAVTVPTNSPTPIVKQRESIVVRFSDDQQPLADRDITLSSSQVFRLVTERPERLSLKILMALLDILDCAMDDLIEPVAAVGAQTRPKKAAGGTDPAGLGVLRPKRARIAE